MKAGPPGFQSPRFRSVEQHAGGRKEEEGGNIDTRSNNKQREQNGPVGVTAKFSPE